MTTTWRSFPELGLSLIFKAGLGIGAEILPGVPLCAKQYFSRIACLLTTWSRITVAAMIICLGTLGTSANAADADQMQQMQQVIDEQQRQLEAQQKQLEAQQRQFEVQQKQLNAQAEVLEQVQIQLGDMSDEDKGEDKELENAIAQTDEPISAIPVAKAGPAAAHSDDEENAGKAEGSDSSSVEDRFGRGDETSGGLSHACRMGGPRPLSRGYQRRQGHLYSCAGRGETAAYLRFAAAPRLLG